MNVYFNSTSIIVCADKISVDQCEQLGQLLGCDSELVKPNCKATCGLCGESKMKIVCERCFSSLIILVHLIKIK